MGVNVFIWNSLKELDLLDFSVKKSAIVMGEQQVWGIEEIQDGTLFKEFLRSKGWEADAIDLGEHPAYKTSLKLDLALPLPEDMKNKYDILFDFGTAEHIRDQSTYWENCHKIVKEEGSRVHALPPPGSWPGHCVYRYTEQFFPSLSKAFEYELRSSRTIGSGRERLVFAYFGNGRKHFKKEDFDKKAFNEIEVKKNFIDRESI